MTHDLYQEVILEEYANPRHKGQLADAEISHHERNASCGDEITVFIRLDHLKQTIVDVSWQGIGCAISIAAASLVSDYVIGKSAIQVMKLGQADVESLLGIEEISPGRQKCLLLALKAFQKALQSEYSASTEKEK